MNPNSPLWLPNDAVDPSLTLQQQQLQLHQQQTSNTGVEMTIPIEVFRQGVFEHAMALGMDPHLDADLMWIAEQSLLAPLPPQWTQLSTQEGQVYFYNTDTGESHWEHPSDDFFRQLFYQKREERRLQEHEMILHSQNQHTHIYDNGNVQIHQTSTGINFYGNNHVREEEGIESHESSNERISTIPLSVNAPPQNYPPTDNDEASALDSPMSTSCDGPIDEERNIDTRIPFENESWAGIFQTMSSFLTRCIDDVEKKDGKLTDPTYSSEEIGNMITEAMDMLKRFKNCSITEINSANASGLNEQYCNNVETSREEDEKVKSLLQEVMRERDKVLEELQHQKLHFSEREKGLQGQIECLTSEATQKTANHTLEEGMQQHEIEELKKSVLSHEATIQKLQETNKSLDKSLTEARKDIDIRQKRFDEIKQERDEMKEKLVILEQELNKNKEILSSRDEEIHKLQHSYSSLSNSKRNIHNDFEHTKDLLQETKDEIQEANEKIKNLETKFESINKVKDEVTNERNKLQLDLEAERVALLSAQEDAASNLDEIDKWQTKYREERRVTRRLNDTIIEIQGNIRVLCRVRPLSVTEQKQAITDPEFEDSGKRINYLDEDKIAFFGHEFEFDRIFAPGAVQGSVFAEVSSAVASSLYGHKVCIFAYGQTGSGKTHTMEGSALDRGVNFRALSSLFDLAKASSTEIQYTFHVSIIEVYNENLLDLISPSKEGKLKSLEIHMRKDEIQVDGITETKVSSCEDVEKLLTVASANRSTGDNNINEHSSRSHLVFSVRVDGRDIKTKSRRIRGKLNLIDLAGSERLKNTGATGQRLKEAQNINRSLSALGDVISALAQKRSHVPYRDTKLTFLLQDSLRPNTKVLMFVTISPCPKSSGESICSLNFASRCRSVQLGRSRKNGNLNTSGRA